MSVAFRRARMLGAAATAVLSLGTADPASAVDTWTVEGRYLGESLFGPNSSGSTIRTDADGNIYVGTNNARVGKFSSALDLIWRRRSKLNVVGASVSSLIIGPDNVVYVGGSTSRDQFAPSRGDDDVWIAKFRTDGSLLGGAQSGGKGEDYLAGIAVEPGGDVIVAADADGTTSVLRRYDPRGLDRWSVTLDNGFTGTVASGVAIDRSGNIYVSGSTGRDLFGPNQGPDDVWLAKYDGDGNLLWGRQFGSSGDDFTAGPVVDSQGSVYLGGFTYGSLFGPNQGQQDAWVAKYDAEGNFVWGQQFGSSGADFVNATCIGPDDHVYVTGSTWPLFNGNGSGGALVAEYASEGTLVRSIQFGTGVFGTADNDGTSCAVTADSMVYVTGATLSVHGSKSFLTKLTPVTTP